MVLQSRVSTAVLRSAARRAALSVAVLLLASIAVFALVRATTDPLSAVRASIAQTAPNDRAGEARVIEQESHRFGLDQPPPVQYVRWLGGFLHGDWGESILSHQSVASEIGQRLWITTQLVFWTIFISASSALVVGVVSAVRHDSPLDHTLTGLSLAGLSMPSFWFALVAIELLVFLPKQALHLDQPLLYSVGLQSATESGPLDYARHLALPVLTLSVPLVARWSRYQRAAMLDVLATPHMRMAVAKGLSRRAVILKHGVRNALVPLITVAALDVGALFGGAIVVETIFALPGMGQLLFNSLLAGDTNVLLPWLMVAAAFVLAFNIAADVLYRVLDPRLRV